MDDDVIYDFLVIGGGVIGTAIARELGSCGKNVILCEKDDVLLSGASSGNTGHLASNFYYRRHRALLEAEMAARARRINPDWISGQPSVPCIKTGMIYIARGQEDEAELEDMLMNAQLNGELGVRKISLEEVSRLEPSLNLSGVTGALYSDNEYIVDSWLLSMTHVYGMEVAGVVTMTSCHVTRVTRDGSIWKVDTSLGIFSAHCVINCAGNFGDTVESLAKNVKNFSVVPSKGEYLVFSSDNQDIVNGTVVPIPSKQTAGVYIFKSVYGHIVVGPTNIKQEDKFDRSVSVASSINLLDHVNTLFPSIQPSTVLGGYAGLRPATEHQDYCIHLDTGRGWVTVAGIRSTGLTCSLAISQYVAEALVEDHQPAKIPLMPAPLPGPGGQVDIGGRLYTPTHPLSRLGLVQGSLPQSINVRSSL